MRLLHKNKTEATMDNQGSHGHDIQISTQQWGLSQNLNYKFLNLICFDQFLISKSVNLLIG